MSYVFVMLTNQTGIDCWIQSISVVLILILFSDPIRSVQFKIDTICKKTIKKKKKTLHFYSEVCKVITRTGDV